jgi:hypothetical protein
MGMIFKRKKARRKNVPKSSKNLDNQPFYKLSLPPNVTMFSKYFQVKALLTMLLGDFFKK